MIGGLDLGAFVAWVWVSFAGGDPVLAGIAVTASVASVLMLAVSVAMAVRIYRLENPRYRRRPEPTWYRGGLS